MTPDLFARLPDGFAMWSPAGQAAALFLSTFVLEDVAAVGAGLLIATGILEWPLAFGACFLGIWIGDAGLYALARVLGRNWFERSSLKRFSSRVHQSERWFAQRGHAILIFSRLLPGARLPTYLAAGFLRLPANRFLLITGAASLVWTILVLLAAQTLGSRLFAWFDSLRTSGWALLLAFGFTMMLLVFFRRLARQYGSSSPATQTSSISPGKKELHGGRPCWSTRLMIYLKRWTHWEFWPAWMFYTPVAMWYLRLAIKHRGLTVPGAANPGIFSGGIIGESKMAILDQLMSTSPDFTAEAELVIGTSPVKRLDSLREICLRRGITYPLVLKPDVGQRGVGVKLVRTEQQARAYLEQTAVPLILQRYAPGPCEAGIFYYRFPHETQGHIFAITEKIFPILTGDGRSTISELIWSDSRARFLAAKYLKRLNGRRSEILPAGETLKLVEAGNHAQGCIFRDGFRLHTAALSERIDSISRRIDGFFVGRYDLRYANDEDLRAGRNFQIIELNGAASEATSIYDPRNSLAMAYRTLFRQWSLVFEIGAANLRNGCSQTPLSVLWKKWRECCHAAAGLPLAD